MTQIQKNWKENFPTLSERETVFIIHTVDFSLRSQVEKVLYDPLNGVIRAIFKFGSTVMVGVELEEFLPNSPLNLTDGTFSGHRFFHC